jgi:glycosyltransferase involved in cell wall biosynthesis
MVLHYCIAVENRWNVNTIKSKVTKLFDVFHNSINFTKSNSTNISHNALNKTLSVNETTSNSIFIIHLKDDRKLESRQDSVLSRDDSGSLGGTNAVPLLPRTGAWKQPGKNYLIEDCSPQPPPFYSFVQTHQPVQDSIPNVIHFVYGLKAEEPVFTFLQYAAVASAYRVHQPAAILFHYFFEPCGFFWELARPLVTLRHILPPSSIFGNPVIHYAHKADIVRLDVLLAFGGIYLDIDVVSLRPFSHLLLHDTVMGKEGENGRIGLCNAVIMSRKNSSFLTRWRNEYKNFNGSQWNFHSVILPSRLAQQFPEEIHVLGHTSFFWPLWDRQGLLEMFSSNSYTYNDSLAVHTWDTAIVREGVFDGFSMQWTFECRSVLLSVLKAYVPDPLVSVIMPCYNQKEYILESIETVLSQTFDRWELVIVDDLSPDMCGSFVEQWAQTHLDVRVQRKIRVFTNEANLGLAESRNAAIRRSRGHFVCALDADDKIGGDYFMLFQEALSQDPRATLFYSDQNFFGESSWHWEVSNFDAMLPLIKGPLPVMSIYSKFLWEKVGGYSTVLPRGNEDYDFWLKLCELGIKGKKLDGAQTFYRYKHKSMMRDGDSYRAEELAMMRVRHPNLYHPAALFESLDIVASMAPETAQILSSRLERGVFFCPDDEASTLLWLAALDVKSGQFAQAEGRLLRVENIYFGSIYSPRIGWQARYLRARTLCSQVERSNEGNELLTTLLHDVPALTFVLRVQQVNHTCSRLSNSYS